MNIEEKQNLNKRENMLTCKEQVLRQSFSFKGV